MNINCKKYYKNFVNFYSRILSFKRITYIDARNLISICHYMNIDNQYSLLLFKYLQENISAEEEKVLMQWVAQNPHNKQLFDEIMDEAILAKSIQSYHPNIQQELEARIYEKIQTKMVASGAQFSFYKRPLFKLLLAATLLLLMGLFFFLDFSDKKAKTIAQQDIQAPNATKAAIILADGSKVFLDSVGVGKIANQGSVKIIKNEDGTISYQAASSTQIQDVSINTLTNPRGSKPIDIQLADGSKVWLNAESSISFPVTFTGNERKVSITGEAYFEVAHQAVKPFFVQYGNMNVQVLGTHFNINAFHDNEQVDVTLLEGSVKINVNNQERLLQPLQQAGVDKNGTISIIKNINVDEVMAWKKGVFMFNHTDIATVMKMLERWYNISYEIKEPVRQHFGGTISKDVSLSKVVEMLEMAGGVQINIEGNKLVIFSK